MTLDDEIDNLRRIPLFAIFEIGALQMLAFAGETRLLRSGDFLFQRGEESDGGFILMLGAIALAPREARLPAQVLRPWALIGEMALVAPSLRPITARAVEPSTVLKIRRALFLQILEQHPLTAARVREFFRERLVDFTREAASGYEGRD
ncbi:cyclic nucleotide-binding domain-containing protein [Methylocystis echinoides]|uniref:cyclic nucleotide-binding domain-containing protein n=1 Tax=Methylocystis echinoides TaxID=29468 RepID=UPI00342F1236